MGPIMLSKTGYGIWNIWKKSWEQEDIVTTFIKKRDISRAHIPSLHLYTNICHRRVEDYNSGVIDSIVSLGKGENMLNLMGTYRTPQWTNVHTRLRRSKVTTVGKLTVHVEYTRTCLFPLTYVP